jgi:hypothetical protein
MKGTRGAPASTSPGRLSRNHTASGRPGLEISGHSRATSRTTSIWRTPPAVNRTGVRRCVCAARRPLRRHIARRTAATGAAGRRSPVHGHRLVHGALAAVRADGAGRGMGGRRSGAGSAGHGHGRLAGPRAHRPERPLESADGCRRQRIALAGRRCRGSGDETETGAHSNHVDPVESVTAVAPVGSRRFTASLPTVALGQSAHVIRCTSGLGRGSQNQLGPCVGDKQGRAQLRRSWGESRDSGARAGHPNRP